MKTIAELMKRNLYVNTGVVIKIKRPECVSVSLITNKSIKPLVEVERLIGVGLKAYPYIEVCNIQSISFEAIKGIPLKKIAMTNEYDLYDMFADSIADYLITHTEKI